MRYSRALGAGATVMLCVWQAATATPARAPPATAAAAGAAGAPVAFATPPTSRDLEEKLTRITAELHSDAHEDIAALVARVGAVSLGPAPLAAPAAVAAPALPPPKRERPEARGAPSSTPGTLPAPSKRAAKRGSPLRHGPAPGGRFPSMLPQPATVAARTPPPPPAVVVATPLPRGADAAAVPGAAAAADGAVARPVCVAVSPAECSGHETGLHREAPARLAVLFGPGGSLRELPGVPAGAYSCCVMAPGEVRSRRGRAWARGAWQAVRAGAVPTGERRRPAARARPGVRRPRRRSVSGARRRGWRRGAAADRLRHDGVCGERPRRAGRRGRRHDGRRHVRGRAITLLLLRSTCAPARSLTLLLLWATCAPAHSLTLLLWWSTCAWARYLTLLLCCGRHERGRATLLLCCGRHERGRAPTLRPPSRFVGRVAAGECTRVFVGSRPPGHHAGVRGPVAGHGARDAPRQVCVHARVCTCTSIGVLERRMRADHATEPKQCSNGFCLYNNVCIGAAYCRSRYGRPTLSGAPGAHDGNLLRRIAIVDFDM